MANERCPCKEIEPKQIKEDNQRLPCMSFDKRLKVIGIKKSEDSIFSSNAAQYLG